MVISINGDRFIGL